MGSLADGLKGKLAAAFTVGAIGAAANKMADYADSVEEMSTRAGVLPRKFQEWLFGAKQNAADAEKLVSFIERLSDAAMDLKNAGGFAALGINPNGMTPGDLFAAVQGKTQGKGSTEIQSILQSVGMSFKSIGPMVNMLAADLGESADQANRFGTVISDGTIHRLAALNDQLSIVGLMLMGQFAPALIAVTEGMMDGVQNFLAYLDNKTGNKSVPATGAGMLTGFGKKAAGVGSGLLGVWDLIGEALGVPGAKEKAEERIDFANKMFEETGFTGAMDAMADALNESAQKGSLSERFAKMREALKNFEPPPLPIIEPGPLNPGGKSNRMPRDGNDSLLSVGNFLGAGRGVIDSLQRETNKLLTRQLAVQQSIADGLKPRGSIIVP